MPRRSKKATATNKKAKKAESKKVEEDEKALKSPESDVPLSDDEQEATAPLKVVVQAAKKATKQSKKVTAAVSLKINKKRKDIQAESEDDSAEEGPSPVEETDARTNSRPSRRAAATKKTKYTEVDSSTDVESDSEADDHFEEAIPKNKSRHKTTSLKSAPTKKLNVAGRTPLKDVKNSGKNGLEKKADVKPTIDVKNLTPNVAKIKSQMWQPNDGDWRVESGIDY